MKNYTLLLVDDEEDVLQVIRQKINWEALGFSVIGTATNGIEALEIMEENPVDVVMTDIKMPRMDGFELISHVKKDYPATKIIIFSGFDEFEYAKEALRLKVGEYLLKPASATELTEVFSQLKLKIDQELNESRNMENLKEYYEQSLPLIQANFYSTLLEGKVKEEDLPKYLKNYQINFTGPYFCCFVLHTSLSKVPEGINPMFLGTSVQKEAKKYFEQKIEAAYFNYLGDTIMLVQLEKESQISQLTDECARFCKYVLKILGAVVTVGIGQVCDTLLKLDQSYASGRMAVSYRGIYGTPHVINIKEVAPQEMEKYGLTSENALGDLFKKIHVGPKTEIALAVDKYMVDLETFAKSLSQHTVAISELIGQLYRFSANNHLNLEPFMGNIKELYYWLPDLEKEALKKWLLDISFTLHDNLSTARNRSNQTLVSKAKNYVHENYASPTLSLDDVCQELGVSNSYFSSMFKKETGLSFISFLTDYRLDHASRLLLETDEKSYIISQAVGYTDPNYFSYVFKKRFGLSPLKYRTGHKL